MKLQDVKGLLLPFFIHKYATTELYAIMPKEET